MSAKSNFKYRLYIRYLNNNARFNLFKGDLLAVHLSLPCHLSLSLSFPKGSMLTQQVPLALTSEE